MTTRSDVELRVPADTAYVAVLRTTTAGLAARLDFTLDDIEDLRIAVGEACAMVLEQARADGDLHATFDLGSGELSVTVSADADAASEPDKDGFAWQVLTALTTRASAEVTPERGRDHLVHEIGSAGLRPPPNMDYGDTGVEGLRTTREQSMELFAEFTADDVDAARRTECRDALVHLHLPLVEHCARRFRNRGEPFDDLLQVGTIGLLKSIDRFDLDRGVEFSTYATPTIIGEIKRYFRDKGWAIRVPRRLQEMRMMIGTATSELSQSLGRSPTPREIAERIGVTVDDVMEGIESSNAYSTLSLDAGGDGSDEGGPSMLDAIGEDDAALEHVEIRESIKPLLEQLPAREKQILLLRFFRGMTQSQIAAEIGVSQMHVSRLLNRTLEQLRESLHGRA